MLDPNLKKRMNNTLVQIDNIYKEQRAIIRSAIQELLISHKEVIGITINLYEYQGLNMGSPEIIVNDGFIGTCSRSITLEGIEYSTLDEYDLYSLIGEREKIKHFYSPLHKEIHEDLRVLEYMTYDAKEAFRRVYDDDVTIIFTRSGESTIEYVYPY